MTEKSINQVVAEFKQVFGTVEFKAVQAGTGVTVASRGWVETPTAALEISGDDFIKLGCLGVGGCPSEGVMQFMVKKLKGKR
jgi:hypothetical protein